MAKKTDHVVMKNDAFFCSNCGESYQVKLPASIRMFTAACNAFIKDHTNCQKTWEEPKPNPSQSELERRMWWLEHGERGISSDTMFTVLSGGPLHLREHVGHPHDPADFRRCHLLLEAVPEWREKLIEMKPISPVWVSLVDDWDKLTEMLLEQLESGKPNGMYEFMKELGC